MSGTYSDSNRHRMHEKMDKWTILDTTRHIEKMNKTLQNDNYRGFSQRIKNASGDKSALEALDVRIT